MSATGAILGALGVGDNPIYSFSQQQKDFIKLQFRYALLLKQKLEAGAITQSYYDNNIALAQQQLEAPYNGWWDEFKSAVQSEDLNWLASQVGETVDALTAYMGSALQSAAQKVGSLAGTVISSTSTGLVTGFFTSTNIFGWLTLGGIGFAIYWGWKKGLIQRALAI